MKLDTFLFTLILVAAEGTPTLAGRSTYDQGSEIVVGFGETDITPKLGGKPVYMAGFGHNRIAKKVHDRLMARAVILRDGDKKIAIVSIDVVGFFHPDVDLVRKQLTDFTYVLVSSTHNHEGPDTLGLWGPSAVKSGVDPEYMQVLQKQIVNATRAAEASAKPAVARIGTIKSPELLHDGREPFVKHDDLVVLKFDDPKTAKPAGIVVQWNCHPETLSSKNLELSADYVGYTVKEIQEQHACPVVYLTGTVGGLMTSLHVDIKDQNGTPLADGTFEKTERYGRLVGQAANWALKKSIPLRMTPFEVRSREFFIPMDNKLYQVGRQLGVLNRAAYDWTGDPYKATPVESNEFSKRIALKTETAWLRFGELDIACIPGEIYPELVLNKVQDPVDPGADFLDAGIEPAIYKQLNGPYRMIVGLANDEIGYIVPKRQWDEKPPFCYARKKSQYGEINSVGPETAPILCSVFRDLVAGKK